MNENIDLTKILKNCPKDAIFYSSTYGNVTVCVYDFGDYPISIFKYSVNDTLFLCRLTKEGKYDKRYDGECTLFPSKDQRDWSKFKAPWYKKEKFDPKTLQPFDKVLGFFNGIWNCDLYSNHNANKTLPYICFRSSVSRIIPYNEDTKHLVGTTEEAPEYYRYWED